MVNPNIPGPCLFDCATQIKPDGQQVGRVRPCRRTCLNFGASQAIAEVIGVLGGTPEAWSVAREHVVYPDRDQLGLGIQDMCEVHGAIPTEQTP